MPSWRDGEPEGERLSVTPELLTDVLAVVGSLLYVATAIPALYVVLRDRDAEAVSAGTLDLLLLSGAWWIVYSYNIDNLPTLISSALAILSPLAIFILKLRAGLFPRRTLAILVLGTLLLVVADRVEPQNLGVGAAVLSVLIVAPTAYRILIRGQEPEGTSWGFWVLEAVTALVWVAYGFLVGHPILGVTGIIVGPLAILILVRGRRQATGARAPDMG